MMEVEKTFAIIKPDAVRAGKAEEIKQLIELHGFTIIVQQKLQLTRARAEEFYGEHHGKPFFPKLVDFMTSGPVWALVLAKPDAIKSWRSVMGPTNVFTAREQAPKCLRALYGTDGTQNACHGSDSPTSAQREIKFFFPNLVLEPLMDKGAAQNYIIDKLQPALSKALTALAREKPTAERFEAIAFLADYLLNHNPNKPKIVLPDQWDPSAELDQEDDEAEFMHATLRGAQKDTTIEETNRAEPDVAAPAATDTPSSKPPSRPPSAAAIQPQGSSVARQSSSNARTPDLPEDAAPSVAKQVSRQASNRAASAAQQEQQGVLPSVEEGADIVAMNEAATKVQATFRGYQARKQVADQRRHVGSSATTVQEAGFNNREELLDEAFKQLDKDGSGYIDKEEFKLAMSRLGSMNDALAEQAGREIDSMDANGDNKVSQAEFVEHLAWLAGVLSDAELMEYLRDAFQIGIGAVPSAEEPEVGAGGGEGDNDGHAVLRQLLSQAFTRLDAAGSGTVNKLDVEALLMALARVEPGLSEDVEREVKFMEADSDTTMEHQEFTETLAWMAESLPAEDIQSYLDQAFTMMMTTQQAAPAQDRPSSSASAAAADADAPQDTPAPPAEAEAVNDGDAATASDDVAAEQQDQEPSPGQEDPATQTGLDEAEPGAEVVPVEGGEQPVVDGGSGGEEELVDLDSFTDQQKAAVVRIQAAGRGMLDRKRVATLKGASAGGAATEPEAETEGNDVGETETDVQAELVAEIGDE